MGHIVLSTRGARQFVLVHVLEGVGKFCAVQDNAPTKIKPDHKEWNGRQNSVEGTLLGRFFARHACLLSQKFVPLCSS